MAQIEYSEGGYSGGVEYSDPRQMREPGAIAGHLVTSQKLAAGLHEITDELRERLSGVVRPSYPPPEGKLDEVRKEASPIATVLMEHHDSLRGVQHQLRDLLDRLEL